MTKLLTITGLALACLGLAELLTAEEPASGRRSSAAAPAGSERLRRTTRANAPATAIRLAQADSEGEPAEQRPDEAHRGEPRTLDIAAQPPGVMPVPPGVPVPLPVPVPPPATVLPGPMIGPPPPGPRMRDMSWIFIDTPHARDINVHDIITVIVSENSEVTQDSVFNRQRNAQLKAQLRQFVRIDDDGNLAPAALDQPTIDGQLRSQLQSFGRAQSREGMRYRIAATVVDVLPNGTVILEARKTIRTNNDVWQYSLTGRIRSEDVLANNTVLSENIADLDIIKRESGKIRDSAKRGILMTLYDWLLPF